MAILIVGTSISECSNCPGISVDPYADAHTQNFAGLTVYSEELAESTTPCGETYTAISTMYVGMDESVAAMRPDLEFVPMGSW